MTRLLQFTRTSKQAFDLERFCLWLVLIHDTQIYGSCVSLHQATGPPVPSTSFLCISPRAVLALTHIRYCIEISSNPDAMEFGNIRRASNSHRKGPVPMSEYDGDTAETSVGEQKPHEKHEFMLVVF